VIGADACGVEVLDLIGRDTGLQSHLVAAPGRPTTVKTRFVANGQQLLRLDAEDARPISREIEALLVRGHRPMPPAMPTPSCCRLRQGRRDPAVIDACLRGARASGAALASTQGRSLAKYGAADLIKPMPWSCRCSRAADDTDAEVEEALTAVLASCAAKAVLVTAGPRPCRSVKRGQQVRHVAAARRCSMSPARRYGLAPSSGPGGQDGPVRCGGIRGAGVRRRRDQGRHGRVTQAR